MNDTQPITKLVRRLGVTEVVIGGKVYRVCPTAPKTSELLEGGTLNRYVYLPAGTWSRKERVHPDRPMSPLGRSLNVTLALDVSIYKWRSILAGYRELECGTHRCALCFLPRFPFSSACCSCPLNRYTDFNCLRETSVWGKYNKILETSHGLPKFMTQMHKLNRHRIELEKLCRDMLQVLTATQDAVKKEIDSAALKKFEKEIDNLVGLC